MKTNRSPAVVALPADTSFADETVDVVGAALLNIPIVIDKGVWKSDNGNGSRSSE